VGYEVAKEYEGLVEFEEMIIDATAMHLVLNPYRFDVLVMENMFGDILSDLMAGLVGGLGMAPSGNIGDRMAMFEPVHGSAPDIAGQGIANPTAQILAACMLLDHLGQSEVADRIRNAIRRCLRECDTLTAIGRKARGFSPGMDRPPPVGRHWPNKGRTCIFRDEPTSCPFADQRRSPELPPGLVSEAPAMSRRTPSSATSLNKGLAEPPWPSSAPP